MAYQLDREQWHLVIAALRNDGSDALADELEEWLARCDVAWESFRVALSKVPKRDRVLRS